MLIESVENVTSAKSFCVDAILHQCDLETSKRICNDAECAG